MSNRTPVIHSLVVLPTSIGPADSAVVTCDATDADGDTLVYDWATDNRLRIKGAFDVTIKSNTLENSQTVYPNYRPLSLDTVFVACTVRDRKGGGSDEVVRFTVHP